MAAGFMAARASADRNATPALDMAAERSTHSGHSAILEQLARLCRNGRVADTAPRTTLPSGFQVLDDLLPGGGWPLGALTELMPDAAGLGELSLLLPALARLTDSGRYLALIEPPWVPQAAALVQQGVALERVWILRTPGPQAALWAAEQILRCPAIGAMLAWPTASLADRSIRRLQLAAEAGGSLGVLYRPPPAALEASPAALRLRLHAAPCGGLCIEIHKARGSSFSLQQRCMLTLHAPAASQAV